MPARDANGSTRIVDLFVEVVPPDGDDVDMGAIEKQTCVP
jgi:hypothetical protein